MCTRNGCSFVTVGGQGLGSALLTARAVPDSSGLHRRWLDEWTERWADFKAGVGTGAVAPAHPPGQRGHPLAPDIDMSPGTVILSLQLLLGVDVWPPWPLAWLVGSTEKRLD